jgi:hypothetical protein
MLHKRSSLRDWAVTRRSVLALALAVPALAAPGCTTCHDSVLAEARNPEFVARALHRVCGVASGFSLQLYRADERPPGRGKGSLEPFQTYCRCPTLPNLGPPPIQLSWQATDRLLVEWSDCLPQYGSRQVPRRAAASYLGVRIEYLPPVNLGGPQRPLAASCDAPPSSKAERH